MRDFAARSGAKLAPHGKTTMSPQLFARQMADGAWGLTVATAHQMRVAVDAGVRRIVLANEVVGPQEIAAVLAAMRAEPGLEVFVLADGPESVRRLADGASAAGVGRPLNVLVEIGYAGGRAGCRTVNAALAVARDVAAAAPTLALAGVEAFEGLNQTLPTGEGASKVANLLADVVAAARAMDDAALFGERVMLSAGGSAYYDMAVEAFGLAQLSRPVEIVLRSGCYLAHDAGLYDRSFHEVLRRSAPARSIPGGFENAIEVWAYVLSVPELGRAILGAGRRDFGHDAGPPRPLKRYRPGRDATPADLDPVWEIVAINDQHAHMTFPAAADVAVGDMVALGVVHPCSTFDKWRVMFVVDDDYRVASAIQTCF
jgi:D-serine dehydratase